MYAFLLFFLLQFHSSSNAQMNARVISGMLLCLEEKAKIRACLHGGGGPHVGEVTRLGGVKK